MRCSLFWGVPTIEDAGFLDYFKEIRENNPLFDYYICLSRETLETLKQAQNEVVFFPGRINVVMELYLGPTLKGQGKNQFEYYVCGSRTVVDSLKTYLFSLGVEKSNVFFEKY